MLIEEKLYHAIRASLPIACVDLLLIHENRYLLLKRLHAPAKDQWWFPGGRIFKDETITEACRRKGREELGLDLDMGEIVSVEESIHQKWASAHRAGQHPFRIQLAPIYSA